MARVIWQEDNKIKRQDYTRDQDAEAFAQRLTQEGVACGVNTNMGTLETFKPRHNPGQSHCARTV